MLKDTVVLCASVNLCDMKPAGLQVCHIGPWPYIAPTPDTNALQITQIGLSLSWFTGTSTGVLQQMYLIISKHLLCNGRQANGWPFLDMADSSYESLHLCKKDSFIHPGSAKKFSSCNAKDWALCYESLRLCKKDLFIHPGSAKILRHCNIFIEHHVNYFTDSCDKHDKTLDGLRCE